jgi:hypothetical protein
MSRNCRHISVAVHVEETPGVDLDSLSYAELERLHAGLMRLTALSDNELAALLKHVLAEEPDP